MLTVNFTPTDTTDYTTVQTTAHINVEQAQPVFSGLTASQSITYGQSPISLSGQLVVPAALPSGEAVTITIGAISTTAPLQSNGSFTTTVDSDTLPASITPYTILYSYPGDTNVSSQSDGSTALTVNRATPQLTWSIPTDIFYGTALLTSTQFDAQADVAGSWTYQPLPTTVLHAGSGQVLTANFTPTNLTDYTTASATVPIDVLQAVPTFSSLQTSQSITYGRTITVSGKLTAPTAIPSGEQVFDRDRRGDRPGNGSAQWLVHRDDRHSNARRRGHPVYDPLHVCRRFEFRDGHRRFDHAGGDPASQTITFGVAPSAAVYGTTFLVDPTSSSGLPVTLTGTNCTIAGAPGGGYDVTTTSGSAAAVLTASQAGDSNYTASDVTETIAAQKAAATVVLANLDASYDGNVHLASTTTTPSGLMVNLVYTQGGNVIANPTSAGSYAVTATVSDPNYQGGTTGTLAIVQPLVTLQHVQVVSGKKKTVGLIVLTFSGPLASASAGDINAYHLTVAGKGGSFTAKGAKTVTIGSAAYSSASDMVILTPTKPFKLKKPVQLRLIAVTDSAGRVIDGGNATAILSGGGATITAVRTAPSEARPLGAIVDALAEGGHLGDLMRRAHPRHAIRLR